MWGREAPTKTAKDTTDQAGTTGGLVSGGFGGS